MRLKLTWCLALSIALVTVYIARLHATQPFGFSGTTLALGRFGEIDASNLQRPANPQLTPGPAQPWASFQKTKGLSDVYVQNNAAGRDVNGDGKANSKDLSWESNYIVGLNIMVLLPATAAISN